MSRTLLTTQLKRRLIASWDETDPISNPFYNQRGLQEAQMTKGGDDLDTSCPVRDTQAQPGDAAMGRH